VARALPFGGMTGPGSPDVSVIVPTRDRWSLLSTHALPSATCQEGVVAEVIVVDDGSTDGTAEALAAIADPRLRHLRHEQPLGVSAARNTGIAAATGRWIAFLDDDDLWAPWKLARQLAAADGDGAPWGYAGAIVVDEASRPLYSLPLPPAPSIRAALEHGNVVPAGPSNVVVRADLIEAVGGFDESLGQGEDWDVWLLLAKEAEPSVRDEVLVATLSHRERSIHRYRRDVLGELERMLSKHRPVTRADRLEAAQWLAAQQYRGGRRYLASRTYLRAAVRQQSPGNLVAAAGALAGERGMRWAARLMLDLRGASHLADDRAPVAVEPPWLERYRPGAGT
jgi:glycosyltransferase involved in cell wall biosynthesis